MHIFNWDDEKNILLKKNRKVCFEDVLVSIKNDKLLDIIKNSSENHPEQLCLVVNISNYAYVVPFVKNGDEFFLKTIFPSRKETKKYLKDEK